MSSISVSATVRGLDEVVVQAMERFHVPGVAVGILNGDEETVRGFGVTNLDNPLDVDGDTLFQIGSTTKTITGLVAMRLVEQGLIELDEPVRTYLPELRLSDADVTSNLTLRHLLTHTGGFDGDYFCDFGPSDDALERAVASMSALAQIAPLGEVWSYCNAGFYIAGRLIEVITGKPYETAAREIALDPIGLDSSFFFPEEVMTYRFASGHWGVDKVHVARPWALPRDIHPVGGIISSARDNLKYARFWLADAVTQSGERLLSTDTVRLMQAPLMPTSKREWIGLTWINREVSGVKLIRHGGGTNGQTSAFMFVPAKNFALTVLTNSSRPEITKAVTEWALKEYLDIEEPNPVPLQSNPNDLAELTGVYKDIASTIELAVIEGRLTLEIKQKHEAMKAMIGDPRPPIPPMSVALIGPDSFVVKDGMYANDQGEFIRRDGRVHWLRFGGRLKTRSF
jgi:CubicO group peptidase (beta-lactamase class C family)